MDNLKNKFSNITSSLGSFSQKSKIIIAIILVIIIFYGFRKYNQSKAENPSWFKNGKDAKDQESISDQLIRRSELNVEFTYHMFLYIAEWDYNIYWFKPIIVKSMNMEQFCPALYFEPVKNNLVAIITSENGKNHLVRVEDFPLKRWTHVALVVKGVNVELYINGLLAKTLPMDSPAKQNEGDVLICPWGGFSGQISKLAYRPKALRAKEIYELSRQPIFSLSWLSLPILNINICASLYKKPTEVDIDNLDNNSLISFGNIDDSMANLHAIDSDLVKKISSKAQKAKLGLKGQTMDECPKDDEAPLCPIGTLACSNNQRYCYYPDRDIMVSTYFNSEYDYCPSKKTGNSKGKSPFMIGGIPVWERQKGKDNQCSNIK